MTIYELCTRVKNDVAYVKTHVDACRQLHKLLEEQFRVIDTENVLQLEQEENQLMISKRIKNDIVSCTAVETEQRV